MAAVLLNRAYWLFCQFERSVYLFLATLFVVPVVPPGCAREPGPSARKPARPVFSYTEGQAAAAVLGYAATDRFIDPPGFGLGVSSNRVEE